MPNYCTKQDIIDQRMTEGELNSMLNDESTEPAGNLEIPKRLDTVLKAVDAQINEYLINYWPLPLSSVPDSIVTIAVDLAAYKLYHRRSGEKPKDVVIEYEHALKRLQRIRDEKIAGRDMLFPPTVEPSISVLVNKTDADRVFNLSMFSKMP